MIRTRRLALSAFATLVTLVGGAHAQPVPKQLPTAPATLQVLHTVATPQEDATVQTVITRLRAKLGADATFASRLDAAITRRDLATAGSLLGGTTQLPRNSIVYGGAAKTGSLDIEPSRPLFRFASYDASAARNPWFLVFTVGGRTYCASTSAATCHDALHKLGYANTETVW